MKLRILHVEFKRCVSIAFTVDFLDLSKAMKLHYGIKKEAGDTSEAWLSLSERGLESSHGEGLTWLKGGEKGKENGNLQPNPNSS